jgi:hypothetical protein
VSTNMIRKQFYIQKRQDALLKRLSKARGLSEAEIIRQAIEREAAGAPIQPVWRALSAIDDFTRLALSKRERAEKAEPYRWNREEIYAERESRWLRDREED